VVISCSHPAAHLWLSKSGSGSRHNVLRTSCRRRGQACRAWRQEPGGIPLSRPGNLDGARLFGDGSNVLTWTLASRTEAVGLVEDAVHDGVVTPLHTGGEQGLHHTANLQMHPLLGYTDRG
jgi:hypothetical protein